MSWLARVRDHFRRPTQLPTPESTRPELVVERARRDIEHRRTDRLARILDDYRAQDSALRR